MVTYCVGSARRKREYFKNMQDAVILDNIEVLFCASENGRNYFAYGAIPFASFTVAQYLDYRRALCGGETDNAVLNSLGLSRRKRLGSLCSAEMRCVMFVEKTGGKTKSPLVVNLDGCKYTRKNRKALMRLTELCETVYVCVTDRRFIKRARGAYKMLMFGKPVKNTRPKFYAAKRLAKELGAYRVAVM